MSHKLWFITEKSKMTKYFIAELFNSEFLRGKRKCFCQIGVGNDNQFYVFSMKKIAKRGICIGWAITSISAPSMFINIKDKIVPIFVANWCGLQIQLSTNFVYKINIKLSYSTVLKNHTISIASQCQK